MPRYRFSGDSPRSLPEYGIEVVSPGETVETVEEISHPDFKLLKSRTSTKPEEPEAAASEPTPEPVAPSA